MRDSIESCWPFLYAANRDLDYRTVVAPDFLVQAKQVSLLRRNLSTAVKQGDEGEVKSSQADANGLGPVTLFYRAVFVKEGGKEVYDDYGRPIVRVSGIALRESKEKGDFEKGEIEALIEQADARLEEDFRAFWTAANGCRAIPSSSIEVGQGRGTRKDRVGSGTGTQDVGRRRATEWIYFLAGAASAAAVGIVVLSAYLWLQEPDQGEARQPRNETKVQQQIEKKVQQLQKENEKLKAQVQDLRKKAK